MGLADQLKQRSPEGRNRCAAPQLMFQSWLLTHGSRHGLQIYVRSAARVWPYRTDISLSIDSVRLLRRQAEIFEHQTSRRKVHISILV